MRVKQIVADRQRNSIPLSRAQWSGVGGLTNGLPALGGKGSEGLEPYRVAAAPGLRFVEGLTFRADLI